MTASTTLPGPVGLAAAYAFQASLLSELFNVEALLESLENRLAQDGADSRSDDYAKERADRSLLLVQMARDKVNTVIHELDSPAASDMLTGKTPDRFLRGRDLAIEMLTDAADGDLRARSLQAKFRDPAQPLDNFAAAYLRRVIADPELLEGFAAVLTDGLANGFCDREVYSGLTAREIYGPVPLVQ